HLTLIQYYYKNYKPNLFDKGKQKLTILHLVIESENMEALNWFLKRNDELKEQGKDLLKERDDTKDSLTPFLFAIEAGHYEMAKRLCEYD
ncbi:ankyrin repeat domain-containing protein, partial [Streptococcus pneumoniae]